MRRLIISTLAKIYKNSKFLGLVLIQQTKKALTVIFFVSNHQNIQEEKCSAVRQLSRRTSRTIPNQLRCHRMQNVRSGLTALAEIPQLTWSMTLTRHGKRNGWRESREVTHCNIRERKKIEFSYFNNFIISCMIVGKGNIFVYSKYITFGDHTANLHITQICSFQKCTVFQASGRPRFNEPKARSQSWSHSQLGGETRAQLGTADTNCSFHHHHHPVIRKQWYCTAAGWDDYVNAHDQQSIESTETGSDNTGGRIFHRQQLSGEILLVTPKKCFFFFSIWL